MQDCFISYSHQDSQIAQTIQNILEQHNIKCWIDFRNAIPGIDYAKSIVHAIKASKVFVIVLSENSCNSIHIVNEINSAVNAGVILLPFKVDDCELSENLEYYLGRTQWMDASTLPLEEHVLRLVNVIEMHLREKSATTNTAPSSTVLSPQPGLKNKCKMLKYEDLLALGYTATSISLQLVENDYINCNGIGMENEGTAPQWEEYLQNNCETFQYLVNEQNKIVGDWSIVALNKEAFDLAMKGELLEADIDIDKTEMICFPGIYYGYILAFSLLPEYRNIKNYNLLIDSFLSQLEDYTENGIYFNQWCMNVFSKEIETLVKSLGFRFEVNNKVHGKLYHCNFMPLPELPIFKKHTLLFERYRHVEF